MKKIFLVVMLSMLAAVSFSCKSEKEETAYPVPESEYQEVDTISEADTTVPVVTVESKVVDTKE